MINRSGRCCSSSGCTASGTSATAGLLVKLGARMAQNPMPGTPDNAKGYWESQPLAHLHNRLLAEAGSAWDDWGRLDQDQLGATAVKTRRSLHGGVRRRAARDAEGPADLSLRAALARGARPPRRRAQGGGPAAPPARGRTFTRPTRRHARGRGAAALAAPLPRGRARHPWGAAKLPSLRRPRDRLAGFRRPAGGRTPPALASPARRRSAGDRRLPERRHAAS